MKLEQIIYCIIGLSVILIKFTIICLYAPIESIPKISIIHFEMREPDMVLTDRYTYKIWNIINLIMGSVDQNMTELRFLNAVTKYKINYNYRFFPENNWHTNECNRVLIDSLNSKNIYSKSYKILTGTPKEIRVFREMNNARLE